MTSGFVLVSYFPQLSLPVLKTSSQVLKKLKVHGIYKVLDIGANKGQWATMAIETLNCKVVSFEPQYLAFEELNQLKEKYGDKIHTFKLAVGDSNKEIPRLILNGNKYDLIYIDGEFSPIDRVTDCFMAWQVLDLYGILIIDDYLTKEGSIKTNIDSFCNIFRNHFKYLYVGNQVIIKKTSN